MVNMPEGYKKVGLFGGTFDPIHLGHLKVALEIREKLNLDHIYFIPARISPFKVKNELAPQEDRLEMIRQTISEYPFFSVSEYELKRDEVSYSIDTIRHYKNILSRDSRLYWILGSDAFSEIHQWKDIQEIFSSCHLLVVSRPGYKLKPLRDVLGEGPLLKEFITIKDGEVYQHFTGHQISLIQLPLIHISSTQLKEMILHGESFSKYVSKSVEEYIQNHNLYRSRSGQTV